MPEPLDPCASRLSAAAFHYLCAQRLGRADGDRRAHLYEKALRDARAAANRAPPGVSGPHGLLGAVWDRLGDDDEALACYRAAAKTNPKDFHAHLNAGVVHQRRGDFVLAEQAYLRAIAADAKDARGHYNLALVRHKRGDEVAAIDAYKAAVDADPGHAKSHAALALLYEKHGDAVRAHRANVNAQTGGAQAKKAKTPIATGAGKHCADYSRFDKVVDSSDDEFDFKVPGNVPPVRYNWDPKEMWVDPTTGKPKKDPKDDPNYIEPHSHLGVGPDPFPTRPNGQKIGRRPT